MIQPEDVRELHLEPSERCNARCPMCGRFARDGSLLPELSRRELTVDRLKRWFSPVFLRQLETIRLCGNFGEPTAAREICGMLEYLRSAAPGARLVLNTNGSLRSRAFWFDIGRLFRNGHSAALFAIDGIGSTHEIYRRGTSYHRVIENLDAFLRGGGRAHWVMLAFEHNEDQIAEARQLAEQMGCAQFTVKRTKRFWSGGRGLEWEWKGSDANAPVVLRAPRADTLRNPRLREIEQTSPAAPICAIRCRAMAKRGLYVSAAGVVLPCCWLGSELITGGKSDSETERFLRSAGGTTLDELHLDNGSLAQILGGAFFRRLPEALEHPRTALRTCSRVCGALPVSVPDHNEEMTELLSGANRSGSGGAFGGQFLHQSLSGERDVRDF